MSSSNSSFFNTPVPVSQENIQWRLVLRTLRSCFCVLATAPSKTTSVILTFSVSVNLDGDGGAPGGFINGGREHLDGGVLIAGFLVKFLHVLGVVEQFELVQGLADFAGELLLEFAEAELFVADDLDVGDDGLALHLVGQVNALGGVGLVDADIAEEAGGVEAGMSSSMVASRRRSPSLLRILARMKASLTAGGPTCWM